MPINIFPGLYIFEGQTLFKIYTKIKEGVFNY